ncbi:MAG: type II secretion system F family protein, partial [Hyphomicrobiales bacterium]|nr:type II secretion system F family protein [Hyphomicrobiales bacterium]
MNIPPLALAAGGAAAIGVALFVFVLPALESAEKAGGRRKAVVGSVQKRPSERSAQADAANRRKQVADSLKEVERRGSRKVTIETLVDRAGLRLTKTMFYVYSAMAGVVCAGLLLFATGYRAAAVAGLVIGALGLPRWFLGYLGRRRLNKFVAEFPNAMDVITRGLKAGLPLGDCLGIIAAEARDPVRSEFRSAVETMRLGVSVGDAVERMVD